MCLCLFCVILRKVSNAQGRVCPRPGCKRTVDTYYCDVRWVAPSSYRVGDIGNGHGSAVFSVVHVWAACGSSTKKRSKLGGVVGWRSEAATSAGVLGGHGRVVSAKHFLFGTTVMLHVCGRFFLFLLAFSGEFTRSLLSFT